MCLVDFVELKRESIHIERFYHSIIGCPTSARRSQYYKYDTGLPSWLCARKIVTMLQRNVPWELRSVSPRCVYARRSEWLVGDRGQSVNRCL